MTFNLEGYVEKNRDREKKNIPIFLLKICLIFFNLNTAPDSPTQEEEHFNQELLDNVKFERLNKDINTSISQEEQ